MPESNQKPDELGAAIAGLEAQRSLLGDAVVEPALPVLRHKLAELHAPASELTAEGERKIVTIYSRTSPGLTQPKRTP